jgi:hypothetical protein
MVELTAPLRHGRLRAGKFLAGREKKRLSLFSSRLVPADA